MLGTIGKTKGLVLYVMTGNSKVKVDSLTAGDRVCGAPCLVIMM
jgi:hypothetical protein